jgi:polyisoprenoid-binding protein YceI
MRKSMAMAMALLFIALCGASTRAQTFKLDPIHSTIVFRIMHLKITPLYGRFDGPTGIIVVNEKDPSQMSFDITVASKNVDTGNAKRDQDLRNQFFDVKQFPDIHFKSNSVKKAGDNSYDVVGDLTLHGVTKPLTVTITRTGEGPGMRGEIRSGWETTFSIKRRDFGIDAMPSVAGDEVTLMIGLEGIEQ